MVQFKKMRFLQDLPPITDKRILLRVDFDVPIEDGKILDETRIKTSLPSIRFLREKQGKVILLAHLGRPTGKEQKFSLKPLLPLLENLLRQKVNFIEDFEKAQVEALNLLENLRFWPGEEANDLNFAKKLAVLGDFYVNDAFAVCHRLHASVVGTPQYLPSFAGKHLEREIKELTKILQEPNRPLVAIIGGAKIETKLPSITNLAKTADKVLVGGRLMFELGGLHLDPNVVVASDDIETKDIGPESIRLFTEIIKSAAMVVWNGPMGVFEEEKHTLGTKTIAEAVVGSAAYSVVGGGDTIAALNKFGLLAKINYVSMGGGAMLEFLAGKKLPGLAALERANS